VARGALLQIKCLRKTQGTQAGRRGVGRPCAGGVLVRASSISPGRARGNKTVLELCHNPQALSNVQEENRSCARDQVPGGSRKATGTDTAPPWRYRRSLVSKGRFLYYTYYIHQRDLCGNPFSSLSKRRYRVVIGYVGDPLPSATARGKARCWLFRGLWRVCEFGKTLSCLWVFVVVASD
jgi:hypothetical protein